MITVWYWYNPAFIGQKTHFVYVPSWGKEIGLDLQVLIYDLILQLWLIVQIWVRLIVNEWRSWSAECRQSLEEQACMMVAAVVSFFLFFVPVPPMGVLHFYPLSIFHAQQAKKWGNPIELPPRIRIDNLTSFLNFSMEWKTKKRRVFSHQLNAGFAQLYYGLVQYFFELLDFLLISCYIWGTKRATGEPLVSKCTDFRGLFRCLCVFRMFI